MPANEAAPDLLSQWTELWGVWFKQLDSPGAAFLDRFKQMSDPWSMSKVWLDACTEAIEGYLRSPAFLENMRLNFKMMTEAKSLQEELARGMVQQSGIALSSDLHRAEHNLLTRLEALETLFAKVKDKPDHGVHQPANG